MDKEQLGRKIMEYPVKVALISGFALYAGVAVAVSIGERLIYRIQKSLKKS